jgi:16S rRNA processing protein RimM
LDSVQLESDPVVELQITGVHPHKGRLLLRFHGIEHRNQAEELVGKYLSVTSDELVTLPEDSYFHFELVGMKVYTEAGAFLGEIREVLNMPANDIWVVAGEQEILIPAVKQYVLDVDRNNRRVTVRLIEGIIEK